jgi:multicomponent Na+:H+ antiporter subunit E
LNWPPDSQHIIVGVFVSAITAFLTGGFFAVRPYSLKHLYRCSYFLFVYIPVFLLEYIKAAIEVSYRIIHPALPIASGIIKVRTTLKSDAGLTFLANSITLTGGNMSVDIDRENGLIYVHGINIKSKSDEATVESAVRRFEKILVKIFE